MCVRVVCQREKGMNDTTTFCLLQYSRLNNKDAFNTKCGKVFVLIHMHSIALYNVYTHDGIQTH